MSDLISRKKIRDYIKGEINPYGKQFEGTAYELGLKIMRYIDAMDSAYDIDRVVDELESELKKGNIAIDFGEFRLFEIVKQCVVSDYVCEWKQTSTARYKTSCGYKLEEFFDTNACYCKQCGKKIKVVEQMDEDELRYCHHDDTDEYHDCLDYMECEECPYYYEDLDQESD